MRMRRLVAAAVVPLLFAAVGCSDKDKEEEEEGKAAASQSCDNLLKPADAAAALPSDIPAGISGATFYQVETQGQTKQYFAYVSGTDFVKVRDDIKAAYSAASIEIEGTDQEEVEAELEFKKGDTAGSVQVIALCKDHLRIRYRVGPE